MAFKRLLAIGILLFWIVPLPALGMTEGECFWRSLKHTLERGPELARFDTHTNVIQRLRAKTKLGQIELAGLAKDPQGQTFDLRAVKIAVERLGEGEPSRMQLDAALDGLEKNNLIDAALVTLESPGRHGERASDDQLIFHVVMGVALPWYRGVRGIANWAMDRDSIAGINRQIGSLTSFYKYCDQIKDVLYRMPERGLELTRITLKLNEALQKLNGPYSVSSRPPEGVIKTKAKNAWEGLKRLADGDVRTGFVIGMSSTLDNKRDEIGDWEKQSPALKKAIEALGDLDLYLTLANRFPKR